MAQQLYCMATNVMQDMVDSGLGRNGRRPGETSPTVEVEAVSQHKKQPGRAFPDTRQRQPSTSGRRLGVRLTPGRRRPSGPDYIHSTLGNELWHTERTEKDRRRIFYVCTKTHQ